MTERDKQRGADVRTAAPEADEVRDVADHPLADPAPDLPRLEDAPEPTRQEIEKRLAEIDVTDAGSIVAFGSSAQAELQRISQSMLEGVRNKDMGTAGDSLREIVGTLRGFSADELDPARSASWWERLMGRARPVAKFLSRYEEVQAQIDRITGDLMRHEHQLLKDIRALDQLYEKTLDYYEELGLYIAAGEERLRRLDGQEIPKKEREARQGDEVVGAQELRDLRAARDDLERRVHDLKLTRQVTMQSLPSIRLVQENDKALVTKINSTLVNTVPLWETQLAQALTVRRSREAAGAVREANDLTNELLRRNAENLRDANREVRAEMERGVFDVAVVKAANDTLIATIEEALAMTDEAKTRRSAAANELAGMERDLRETLSAARARRGEA